MGNKLFTIPVFIFITTILTGYTLISKSSSGSILPERTGYDPFAKSVNELFNLSPESNNEFVISDGDTIVHSTQRKIRVSKYRRFKNSVETVITRRDTVATVQTDLDKIKIDSMAIDSTARLEQFKYRRNDNHNTELRPKRKFRLYAYPSNKNYTRTVELDSTGTNVIVKEKIGRFDYKHGLKIPIEDYIEMEMKNRQAESWEALVNKYELKSDEEEFQQLISSITNIDIPLPSSSIFSIFGPPKISLRVNGSVDIHGAWRNETTEGVTASLLGNTRNEPDFKQQVRINVQGTVGDKLTLSADWNTERDFEYENQLKLQYKGYEDEIIQSIEAGNVSLQASPLVGGSEALFGIKANFKMGPFQLTALASQKKGETEEVSLSGGSKSQTFEIRAYDYSKNHYFIHEVFADREKNIFNDIYGNPTPVYRFPEYKIKDLEIWKSITGLVDPNERRVNAYIDLESRNNDNKRYPADLRDQNQESVAGEKVIGTRFKKLEEGTDYTINKDAGVISFNISIQNEEIIAAAFKMEGLFSTPNDDMYYGEFIQDASAQGDSILVLKLIKPANLQPSFKKAWSLQLKNIYPIGGKDVKKEGFVLDIKYKVEGQEARNDFNGTKLLEVFSLDKTDESGTSTQPDGAFDFYPGRTINTGTGEIIFPVLEPFGRDLPAQLPDTLQYLSVYDTTNTIARNDRAKDKFAITGEYSAAVTSMFQIGFNVVENSVKVFFNGNELDPGIDYTVDYLLGQVRIRKEEALVPGADLRITYEKNDLFQMASKTMLGLRGIYEFNERTKLGFSYLSLNQQTLSDKVRIGEEPMNNSIMGVDFTADFDLPFITKGLDYLMSTREMSNFKISAEYAYISPEPNTKESKIKNDNGKSIAYIDDFEGAKRIIPIGDNYSAWTDISIPNNLPNLEGLDRWSQMGYKAKTYWFNVLPSNVNVYDIWGNRKSVPREDEQQTVLDLIIDPTQRGTYNYNPTLDSRRENWGGMMKRLSSTASNLIDENIEFIEFWANVELAPEGGAILYIDLGQISEDVIPNGELNTEDINFNDQIDPGEDVGMDGMTDAQEQAEYGSAFEDPSNDNFSFSRSPIDYTHINKPQGSASNVDRLMPDTEDLNRNSNLDRLNSYFRYAIPLDTNRVSNPFVAGGGFVEGGKWYLYRVPLKDWTEKIGDPSLSIVETIRIWSRGLDGALHVRMLDINLVGNQWRKLLVPGEVTEDDEVLSISIISLEDDPEYWSPPGLEQERDRSNTEEKVLKNEQSLKMEIKGLEEGKKREIVKYLYRPLDLFNYKEMKMFFWGDSIPGPDRLGHVDPITREPNAEVFFRFGADSLNYYEYRAPIEPSWQEMEIKFADLTPLKQIPDSLRENIPVEGKPGHYYNLRGKPTLTGVTYLSIGILNPTDVGTTSPVEGEIWLNELRVLDADNTPGWAYKTTASLKLADFIKIDVNAGQTDPNFHKLTERFGNRIDSRDWGLTANINLLKLIPFNLSGSNLNVSYSRKETISKPIFVPGTDIKVDEAVERLAVTQPDISADSLETLRKNKRTETETMSVSETWTLSNIKIRIPSNAWYIRDIINGFSFSFNYNTQSSRNPTTLTNTAWRWDGTANYNLNLGNDKFFEPAKIPVIGYIFDLLPDYKTLKIFYVPQTFTLGMNVNRRKSFNQSRTIERDSMGIGRLIAPNIQREFTSGRNGSFSWRITDGGFLNTTLSYNFSIKSSLSYLLVDEFFAGEDKPPIQVERPESEIWHDIFSRDLFGRDYDYTQSVDIKFKPKLPQWGDLDRNIQIQAGYTTNYNWLNNFQQETLGRSAKFTSRFNASITIKLKQIFDPLFESDETNKSQVKNPALGSGAPTRPNQRNFNQQKPDLNINNVDVDSVLAKSDSLNTQRDSVLTPEVYPDEYKEPFYNIALRELKYGVRWVFFDYDQITVTYNHENSYGAGGLRAEGNGFSNFWGYKYHDFNGPSRLFMLGMSYDAGPRAPNGTITDNSIQKNIFDLKTSRKLWEGANLSINWHLDFGTNGQSRITTDSLGFIKATEISSTGTLNRSFISFPKTFIFSFLGGKEMKDVRQLYDPDSENPTASLSDAFATGFETLPLLSKIPGFSLLAKYIPRPNWSLSWSGIEKIDIFSFADKVSLNHAYTSSFSEGWKINTDGTKEVQTQRIDYGFSPLIGITFSKNKLLGGDLNTSFKYSTRSTYSLAIATRNITEDYSTDITVSLSYNLKGFELPMFGIAFKNDLEVSINYTSGKSSTVLYNMDEWLDKDSDFAGVAQNGQTRTQMEPRLKFQMSQTVSASLFYRRTTFEPEGAARTPGTTTNEMGLDVNILIK